jgi:hypothetical protein
MTTALYARVWVDHFLDREQQPMPLTAFADTITGQFLH